MPTERGSNGATTSINQSGGITASATGVTVAASTSAGFPNLTATPGQFRVQVEQELWLVTATSGTDGVNWTITRHIEGTTAAAHVNGSQVVQKLTWAALENLAASGGTPTSIANGGGSVIVNGSGQITGTAPSGQDVRLFGNAGESIRIVHGVGAVLNGANNAYVQANNDDSAALGGGPSGASGITVDAAGNVIVNGTIVTVTPALKVGGLTGATQASRYAGATTSGAPVSGTFAIGDFVIARNGHVWICTTTGTPGTWTDAGGGGGGSMSSFTLAGDGGSSQTINDGNTLTVAGGTGLASTAGATDTVTVDLDIDSLTPDGSPDGAADYVATWDASASAHKKVLLNNLPGGGGGSTISRGAYASRPAAGTSGNLYLASDSPIMSFDDGAVWREHYQGLPLVNDTFPSTWVNQGGASTDTTRGGVRLFAPATAVHSLRLLTKTAPSTPYTVVVLLLANAIAGARLGIGFRDSGTGKVETLNLLLSTAVAAQYEVAAWDSATGFNSYYAGPTAFTPSTGGALLPIWLYVADDGTNRSVGWLPDGITKRPLHSIARTSFLTPNQVCLMADSGSATAPDGDSYAWFLSYDEQ